MATAAQFRDLVGSRAQPHGYEVAPTEGGFVMRDPERPRAIRFEVALDEERRVYRITDAGPGFRGRAVGGSFQATWAPGEGWRTRKSVDPGARREVIRDVGAELGWTETDPTSVRVGKAIALAAVLGALLTVVVLVWVFVFNGA